MGGEIFSDDPSPTPSTPSLANREKCAPAMLEDLMLYPLTFHPIFKERVWGGRRLERDYQKPLPPSVPIGESWEISDRPEGTSVIANGPLAGKDLHWLMDHHSAALLGSRVPARTRFPLLIKILDAAEKLSVQVHPPAALAKTLGGEPKTEMWFIAEAGPEAELFAGLRRGVTRKQFEQKIKDGTVADCLHRIRVRSGDALFLPSGRLHAIGADNLIFEIQQNSDTTYRVFDWNRVGLDGQPRELHLSQSLAAIDFQDFEPPLLRPECTAHPTRRRLVHDALFKVDLWELSADESVVLPCPSCVILGVVEGKLHLSAGKHHVSLRQGQFGLLPACLREARARAESPTRLLRIETGGGATSPESFGPSE